MSESARKAGRRPPAAAISGFIAVAAAILPPAPPAVAAGGVAASPWAVTDQSRVRLVSSVSAVGSETVLMLGLQIELAPGWKTYWRSPGDSGLPPRFDWSGSRNLAGATVLWPAPTRYRMFGLDTFGYVDEVVFPVTVRPARVGAGMGVRLAVDYGICKEICIPYRAELALDLAGGPAGGTPYRDLVDGFAARVPAGNETRGLAIEAVRAGGSAGASNIEITARADPAFVDPDLFAEGGAGIEDIYFGAPAVTLSDGGRRARFLLPVEGTSESNPLVGREIVLTLVDGGRAVEHRTIVAAGD